MEHKTFFISLDDLSHFYDDMHTALDAYTIASCVVIQTKFETEEDRESFLTARNIEADLWENFIDAKNKYVDEFIKQQKTFEEFQRSLSAMMNEEKNNEQK